MRDLRNLLVWNTVAVIILALYAGKVSVAWAAEPAAEKTTCQIQIDAGHPWRPPFELERIGRSLAAVVEIVSDRQPPPECVLVGYVQGKEIARSTLTLIGKSPYTGRAMFDRWPTELVLLVKSEQGTFAELSRLAVTPAAFEADAVARSDRIINPVDLGMIFPPSDWLVLADGQQGTIDVAAICRTADMPEVRVTAWFDSVPAVKTTATMAMVKDCRMQLSLPLPPAPATVDHDVLRVSIGLAGGAELWHKKIETMVAHHPPQWPGFGAIETKLRYDAPISVRRPDGKFASMKYAEGWDPKLKDVVVALPNGSRFIFWRGSCYIPFWAGRHNTGFCYEWAECQPPADAVDCVEPLMDKELRYSRVQIIESTPARVHVRWSYQSCDFNYKVWGDSAVEDFYFYPDGFGARVVTLRSNPKANYELSELIVLTPQSTYPLSVLPHNMLEILFLDGQKRELTFPFLGQGEKLQSRDTPAIFRVRLHKDERTSAIYFSPLDKNLPQNVYGPFVENGHVVTPVYWGSHWPLARGNTTGGAIDDRISLTPAHNSIVTWAWFHRPMPVRNAQFDMLDALGRSKPMLVQTWAWLIAMSDADDARLLQWARSFSKPPSVELEGAQLDADSYVPERRAIRLIVKAKTVTITMKPTVACVNPVFELSNAPKTLFHVRLADHLIDAKDYAWDGKTLWLNTTVAKAVALRLEFGD